MPVKNDNIVDAHVHWWDVETNPWYEFIRNVAETTGTDLYNNYLPADYRRSIGDARVSKVVHVSAVVGTQRYVDELRWLDGVADGSGFEVGCVGSVDPALDPAELKAHLDAQLEVGRLRGIRVLEGLEPDGETARTLADWLIERQLVFDLVAHPDTLARWTRFVAARPQLSVAVVGPEDRLLLYSDGVSERRRGDGERIGELGLRTILAALGPRSAATTVRGLQDAVINASPDPLRDDATLLLIAPHE